MLAYAAPADIIDEYCRLGESTILESFKQFNQAVISLYGQKYLRPPSDDEAQRLSDQNAERGFPGCIGSIDCMHWRWLNCPKALAGQFKGYKKGGPTLVLEAVVDKKLRFWHAFFGLPGTLNDINVWDRSPLLTDLFNGVSPKIRYVINGKMRTQGYYLADGIYPEISVFVKTVSEPSKADTKLFAVLQEAARKDVERGFGVLQASWRFIPVLFTAR
eukprot:TRINITY_DN3691_c0_g1_i11.p2 TRINITY_DN3691_c0_g1~~TRINITY_DN3691_c0_g1_i11.p2  ORF type:complete len:217 (+),score=46.47 TRINITY_DN3691_c0_g1_i11:328-978(+)